MLRSKNNTSLVPCLQNGNHRQPVTVDSIGTTFRTCNHQLKYSDKGKVCYFYFKSVAFCMQPRPSICRRCHPWKGRDLQPPLPPGRLVQPQQWCLFAPIPTIPLFLLPLSLLLLSPLLGPKPLASTARTVKHVPRRHENSI